MNEGLITKANQRLESVCVLVQEMIISIGCEQLRQGAYIHLYGVSSFASMLAMKRGRNQELAAIIGLLHNYYFFKTGVKGFPGPNSADTVRPLLREMNMFTNEELTLILNAIFYQEDRNKVQGPYEEILKDAQALHSYFQNIRYDLTLQDNTRLRNVLRELTIPEDFSEHLDYDNGM